MQQKFIWLIQFYESKPFLWNPNEHGSNNKFKRKAALDKMPIEMDIGVPEKKNGHSLGQIQKRG